jgi:endonuclease V-like protein UPF0215 family
MGGATFELASLVENVKENNSPNESANNYKELHKFLNDDNAMDAVKQEITSMQKENPEYLEYFARLLDGVKIGGKNLLKVVATKLNIKLPVVHRVNKIEEIHRKLTKHRGGRRSTRRSKRSRRARTRRQ